MTEQSCGHSQLDSPPLSVDHFFFLIGYRDLEFRFFFHEDRFDRLFMVFRVDIIGWLNLEYGLGPGHESNSRASLPFLRKKKIQS